MRNISAAVIAAIWGLTPVGVQAQASGSPEAIVTDRPDQTESSLTIPRGLVQVEGGWSLTQAAESGGRIRDHAFPELLVRLGVASRLEIRAGFGGWRRNEVRLAGVTVSSEGTGDVELGFKYRLAHGSGTRPAIALLTDVAVPTGSGGFSGGQVSPVMRVAVSHELSALVGTGYNAGVSIFQAADGNTGIEALYTWTFGFAVAERVGMFIETFGTVGVRSGNSRALLDGGLTIQVRPNLQFDLAGGVGLSRHAEDWFMGAGVSARLPR
jgi:hypothetical protein